jgi:hypothetical protein
MSYGKELNELREMRKICYEIIKRIGIIEQICEEKSREWCLEMNRRLRAIDPDWFDEDEHKDKEQLCKPYESRVIGVRVDKSKATELSDTACAPPRRYSGLDDE